MTQSSYLQHLPPVLWADPQARGSLGAFLCIFEKLLTGIDDGVPIGSGGGRTYAPIADEIARVHRLFDPSVAPLEFLDVLASWVALEFPKIGETYLWDEHQRRKLTAGILQVYRRRGLRDGINRYLDLYTVAATRSRIAVDDGSRILRVETSPGRVARIQAVVTQGPDSIAIMDGLIRPLAVAMSPLDDSMFVSDQGTPSGFTPEVKPGIWRIPQKGATPQRVGDAALSVRFPAALAVGPASGKLYVLDTTGLFELAPPFTVATRKDVGVKGPTAMCALANGHLLILDRGQPFQSGAPAAAALVDVQLEPFSFRRTALAGVIEPMSLCVTSRGEVIIGDGREQDRAVPADLLSVDLNSGAATRILGDEGSRLTAPVAIVAEDQTRVLVLDLGLKPYFPALDSNLEAYVRHSAEPATLYRVTLGPAPVIEVASTVGDLVFPTGMALVRGNVFITDKGEYSDPQFAGETLRVWRASAQEFGVAVHFSEGRKPSDGDRRRILHDIQEIIEREKPAHTNWTMVFSSS